jgi:serine/threonine protein kinase
VSADRLAPGTVVDGRYVVEDELGEGGMAVVYRVRHRTLGTPMALKLLTVSRGSVRDRLLQEGRVQAALRHPNIVAALDTVVMGESIGLVMEYVRGPSLYRLLSEMRLDWNQIDDIARGLFDGISAAHKAGLVHRDLKPDNVLIELAPGRLIPKIADFGLVKLLDTDGESKGRTRTGTTFGTPEYMAPEQISDVKGVDARADVFSIGVMLFEMVTGTKPFADDDLLELFNKISKGRRPSVAALRPDAPERMVRAIDAALMTDRAARAQTIDEVRARWTEGIPAHQGEPWSEPVMEQVRRLGRGEEGIDTLRKAQSLDSAASMTARSQVSEVDRSSAGKSDQAWAAGASPSVVAIEQAPARRRLWAGVGLLGASVAAFLAGTALLGVLAVWWFLVQPALPPAPPAPPVRAVVVEPEPPPPVADPEPPVAPPDLAGVPSPPPPDRPPPDRPGPPAPPALPPPDPVPEPAPAPAPAVVEPAPAPAPPAPAPVEPAHVRLVSTTPLTVELQRPDGHPLRLGDVPAGRYTVFAWFVDNGQPTQVAAVDLAPGSRSIVRCDTSARICKVVKESP